LGRRTVGKQSKKEKLDSARRHLGNIVEKNPARTADTLRQTRFLTEIFAQPDSRLAKQNVTKVSTSAFSSPFPGYVGRDSFTTIRTKRILETKSMKRTTRKRRSL
jgi:hypothetical protein